MDTEVTAEVVGLVPGHSEFGGMPGLAGSVLELAQFKSPPGIFLALTLGATQCLQWHRHKYLSGTLLGG